MTKRTLKFLSAGLLAAVLLADPARAQTNATSSTKHADKMLELFGDSVVAKGKGVEIKRSELDSLVISYKAAAAAAGQAIPAENMPLFEQRVLQDMIGLRLLLNKATDADKAAGKERFQAAFQKFKTDAKLSDDEFEEKLALQLRAQGMTREQWDKQRLEQATVQVVVERELKITVSDADAKKFYDENPAKFEEPEMVRVSHILIGTLDLATRSELPADKKLAKRKVAEDVLKRARSGEDFGKLVKEFSDDPGSKNKGGEYTFARASADPTRAMVPEFEAAAFSLNTNQISDIVTTTFGFHIIKLLEKIPAKKVELDKVADRLKEGLKQQEMAKRLPEYVEGLKKDANVEILDEKLKPKDFGLGDPARAKPVEKK